MVKSRKVKNIFQSTPSVGRATLDDIATMRDIIISIHALRGEGDHNIQCGYSSNMHFNPRPPWGGRRKHHQSWNNAVGISIHTLRGEGDGSRYPLPQEGCYFNPRPPWGGRLASFDFCSSSLIFQSTPSVGRATPLVQVRVFADRISIHALRGEGDRTG